MHAGYPTVVSIKTTPDVEKRRREKQTPSSLHSSSPHHPTVTVDFISMTMAVPPTCVVSYMYTYPDSSVLLFNCGAKVFFQFIVGDLPIQWVPFIDSPFYANGAIGMPMNSLANYPLCPHQSIFAQVLPFWCLGQKRTPSTPCWLVVQADINRASVSQTVVKWAREIRLDQAVGPDRSADGPRMPPYGDQGSIPDGLPTTRSGDPLTSNQLYPVNSHSQRDSGPPQACDMSASPSSQLPPTPANSTIDFGGSPSPSTPFSDDNPHPTQPRLIAPARSGLRKDQGSAKKPSRKRLSTGKSNTTKRQKLVRLHSLAVRRHLTDCKSR